VDSSAGRDDRQKQIGPDVEAATGDTSAADVVLGPNEGSSTGNVTGGRKLARYDFGHRWRWGERKLPQRNHQPVEVGGDDQPYLAARQRQHCAVLVD